MSEHIPAGMPQPAREALYGPAKDTRTRVYTVSSPDTLTTDQIKSMRTLGWNVDASGNPLDEKTAELIRNGKKVFGDKKEEDESTSILDKAVAGVEGIGSSISRGIDEVSAPNEIKTAISELANEPADPIPEVPKYEPPKVEETISEANEEAADIEEDEEAPMEEKKAVKRYSDATMSIQDAYANGLIDKNTRDYLIIDAIATFAKNLGRSIGNIGAQFTGGTIDNTVDESKWSSRQAAKWNQEQQMELEDTINSPEWRQREAELKSLTSDELSNRIKQVQANYSEKQIQQTLKNLAQQYNLGSLNAEILSGKINAARIFQEMQNNSNSKLGQLGYGLLTTLAYGGGSGLTSAIGSIGSFLPW